jgi:uncharacterized protein (TIGR03067 family)
MQAIVLIVPLLLGAGAQLDGQQSGATSEEARRALEMFQGVWSFTSINDNGEKFGPELIDRAFAQNGQVTVKGNALEIVNPETGKSRTATFRIDPSKSPRRIDLVNPDNRIYRGIYKFEGDNLVICLERDQEESRPIAFEANEGSERVLFRLTPASLKKDARSASRVPLSAEEAAAAQLKAPELAPPERTRLPEIGDRKATPEELRRAHEMLAGDWQILSIVDDGSDVGSKLIRAKFAEDGLLHIGNRLASFVTPSSEEKHVSAIRIDPAKSPSWIDFTTQLDAVLKGIYKFDGGQLILCLAKHEETPRPTEFESPSGSDRALFRLTIAKPETRAKTEVVSKPEPRPTTKSVATSSEPSAEEKARRREERIREMLAGSWTYNDKKGAVTLVLRPDGTFVSTRSWAKAMKRLFEGRTATSEGRWAYSHGSLTGRISSTTDPFLLGHGFSARLQSIGEETLVFRDVVGELKTARRLR